MAIKDKKKGVLSKLKSVTGSSETLNDKYWEREIRRPDGRINIHEVQGRKRGSRRGKGKGEESPGTSNSLVENFSKREKTSWK